ncbi:hypothetical protein OG216_39120 [Streptomycetaceae bacterium NBC_01309]
MTPIFSTVGFVAGRGGGDEAGRLVADGDGDGDGRGGGDGDDVVELGTGDVVSGEREADDSVAWDGSSPLAGVAHGVEAPAVRGVVGFSAQAAERTAHTRTASAVVKVRRARFVGLDPDVRCVVMAPRRPRTNSYPSRPPCRAVGPGAMAATQTPPK